MASNCNTATEKADHCDWQRFGFESDYLVYYETNCGRVYSGARTVREALMHYCPYCGKKIEAKDWEKNENN